MQKIVLGGVILIPLLLLMVIQYAYPRHQVARNVPPAPLEIHLKIIDQDGKPVPGLRLNLSGGVARAFSSSVVTQEDGGGSISDAEGRVTFKSPLPANGILRIVGDSNLRGSCGVVADRGVYTNGLHVRYWSHLQPYAILADDHFQILFRSSKDNPIIFPVWRSRGLVEIPFLKFGDNPHDMRLERFVAKTTWSGPLTVNLGITGDGGEWPQDESPYELKLLSHDDPLVNCTVIIRNHMSLEQGQKTGDPNVEIPAGLLEFRVEGKNGAKVAPGDSSMAFS